MNGYKTNNRNAHVTFITGIIAAPQMWMKRRQKSVYTYSITVYDMWTVNHMLVNKKAVHSQR